MSAVVKAIEKQKTVALPLKNFATPFEKNFATFGVYYNGKSIVSTHLLEEMQLAFFKNTDAVKIENLKQIFYQNGYYLLRFQDTKIYRYHAELGFEQLAFTFEKLYAIELPPHFKGMLFSDGKETYFFAENGILQQVDLPPFTSGCYFYDRLLLCKESSIVYSVLGDSFQFLRDSLPNDKDIMQKNGVELPVEKVEKSIFEEGAGQIVLVDKKGAILNAIPFQDKLYFVRERGIDIVTMCGVEKHFTIQSLFDTSQIAAESCCLTTDGRFYFYTEEGLYMLQNKRLQKLEISIENACQFCREMPAVYLQNCYYLLANKIGENEKNLYAIYTNSNSVAICANAIENIQTSGGKFFVLCKDKVLTKTTFGQALPTKKELFLQVFNPFAKDGILKGIQVECLQDMSITIKSAYGVQRKSLLKNTQYLPVHLRGNVFNISMHSCAKNFEILDIKLQFSALQGVKYA